MKRFLTFSVKTGIYIVLVTMFLSGCTQDKALEVFDFRVEASDPSSKALANSEAKKVFWTYKAPSQGKLQTETGEVGHTIGGYAHGCISGAEALPVDGDTWQAMRLSRERYWGHPRLISFIKKLAQDAPSVGWKGLLVGDMAQARGGPMKTGHASHQSGLDADIWLIPMPEKRLTNAERETLSATNMVLWGSTSVNPKAWGQRQYNILKLAAVQDNVARIFVNPVIKKALCENTAEEDRGWLNKVRPWYGHTYHFHVRLSCDPADVLCVDQHPVGKGHGCGDDLARWFKPKPKKPKTVKPVKPVKPKLPKLVRHLPEACLAVLQAPDASLSRKEQQVIPTSGLQPIPPQKAAE